MIEAVLGSPLFLLGLILALGALLGDAAERLRIPWISGCILLGVALGPAVVNVLPASQVVALDGFTQASLAVIAFNIGSQLTISRLKTIGRSVVLLAVAQLLAPFALVLAGETMAGLALPAALILAAVAPATAPTTTYSVIRRREAAGPFVDRALGVLALNDAACVLIFSAVSAGVVALLGARSASTIGAALWGAAANEALSDRRGHRPRPVLSRHPPVHRGWHAGLGIAADRHAAGAGAAEHRRRHRAATVPPAAAAEPGHCRRQRRRRCRARTDPRPINGFEEPLFIVFFVLAGAHLPVTAAENLALLAAAAVYLACRFAGKYGGVYLTASALRLDPPTRRYLGLCFPSQGALAMGLILAFRGSPAVQQLPAAASQPIEAAVSVILISVLLSQLAGPLLIDFALRRGNAQPQAGRGETDRRGQEAES